VFESVSTSTSHFMLEDTQYVILLPLKTGRSVCLSQGDGYVTRNELSADVMQSVALPLPATHRLGHLLAFVETCSFRHLN